MTKSILFIGAGQHQLPGFESARRAGLRVIAFDGDPQAPGLQIADEYQVVDIKNPQACLQAAEKYRLDGVLSLATEAGVRSAALIAERFELAGTSYLSACAATDKLVMREAFHRNNVASTDFRCCRTIEEALTAYRQLGPRAVIKPSNSAGSRGVSYVDREADVAVAFAHAAAVAGDGDVLLESFLDGIEVAVDGFMIGNRFHGLCVSEKIRTKPPHLLDLSVWFPTQRPVSEVDAILDLARDAAIALDIRNAPVHVEIMLTPRGPRMVEIAARGAGFHVFTKIMPWVTGVETVDMQIDLCLGKAVQLKVATLKAAILDFPTVAPGKVVAVDGVEKLAALENVLFFEIFRKVGDQVCALRSGADRVAALCVKGETPAQARTNLEKARGILQIVTEAAT